MTTHEDNDTEIYKPELFTRAGFERNPPLAVLQLTFHWQNGMSYPQKGDSIPVVFPECL